MDFAMTTPASHSKARPSDGLEVTDYPTEHTWQNVLRRHPIQQSRKGKFCLPARRRDAVWEHQPAWAVVLRSGSINMRITSLGPTWCTVPV